MRKKTFAEMQAFVQAKDADMNRAVLEFRNKLDADEWNRLRQRVRSVDEQRVMDEACAARYQLLKSLGLVSYDWEKRVMTIARLDVL